MSLGERSLRTIKHLSRVSPLKHQVRHHGILKYLPSIKTAHKQQLPVLNAMHTLDIDLPPFVMEKRELQDFEPIPEANTPGNDLTSFEGEFLHQNSESLVLFLNDEASFTSNASKLTPPKVDVVSAYLTLRRSPSSLSNLQTAAYARIAKHAEANGLQQVMSILADDVLSHFSRESDPEGFSLSLIAILSRATHACPLSPQTTLRLYEALVVSHPTTPLPLEPDVIRRIATASLIRPDAFIPPLETLAPPLLQHHPTDSTHTKTTQLAYELLMNVMMEGEQSYTRALSLFQELITAKRIPRAVQSLAGEQGGSFPTVISSALVRSCLWFQWPTKAAELLMELIRDPQWPRAKGMTAADVRVIAELGLEVLRALLPSSSRTEIQTSRSLIMALNPISDDPPADPATPSPSPLEIPHELIFTFYDSCHLFRDAESAAHVYHHLQSPQNRQYYDYPPPRNAALLWLLGHFASPGVSQNEDRRRDLEGRLYIARDMIKDILRRKHPVHPMARPRLVALAAARGFGLYARRLWELYTAEGDPDRDFVRGNAHMLVPIVRLFATAQTRWDTVKTSSKPNNGVAYVDKNKEDSSDPRSLPRDYLQFAERVLASFIEAKQPLAMASRFDLNALARAQLILGHLPEGMNTLTLIMDRAETPGIRDLNVALATLARYSPVHATQMIQHMLRRGVQPSASTFSTVLHEAQRHNDTNLVQTLVTLAKDLGYGALTHKGLAFFLRSAMDFQYTCDPHERLRQQWNAGWAMNTVMSIMNNRSKSASRSDHVKDHALSISVGIQCVKGSLRAVQPQMAFRFWKLLVKDRVLLDDQEHMDLRAWIARSIRHEWREKLIKTIKANNMLTELGAPGADADGPRVPNPRQIHRTRASVDTEPDIA